MPSLLRMTAFRTSAPPAASPRAYASRRQCTLNDEKAELSFVLLVLTFIIVNVASEKNDWDLPLLEKAPEKVRTQSVMELRHKDYWKI